MGAGKQGNRDVAAHRWVTLVSRVTWLCGDLKAGAHRSVTLGEGNQVVAPGPQVGYPVGRVTEE